MTLFEIIVTICGILAIVLGILLEEWSLIEIIITIHIGLLVGVFLVWFERKIKKNKKNK